jgi:hypothetical protein
MAEPVNTPWPYEVPLARVDRGDIALRLEPDAAQRKAIAKQLGLVSLEAFSSEVYLSSWMDGAEVSGRLSARVVQTCSVSADDFEEAGRGAVHCPRHPGQQRARARRRGRRAGHGSGSR